MPKYKFKRTEITTEEEVRDMIQRAKEPWLKAIIAFLYVFGCRISEAIKIRRKDVWIEGNYLVARIGVLKRKKEKRGPYVNIPHLLHVNLNSPFVHDILLPYINSIEDRNERLFPRTRQLVWLRLKELNQLISPHVFRHDRLMKLALKGASEAQLMDWAGWSDPRPAQHYIRATGRLARQLADKVD